MQRRMTCTGIHRGNSKTQQDEGSSQSLSESQEHPQPSIPKKFTFYTKNKKKQGGYKNKEDSVFYLLF